MKEKLHDNYYWHLLLHMNGNVSEIDDPNFFFATNGKIDPKAELLGTLDAFFSDEKKDDNSSICRFPARYEWLKEELNINDFPTANCKEYRKILDRVDPKSVTLVFPSAHINSPASMFGHTFLRINSSYNSKLLSYAVNYAANANTETENGVVFALKGLFGGYYGRYSLLPYYEKLKEYRDSEQRDIWEYNLDLTQSETLQMFRHIWELNGTNSFYYFFTENCSYNMLWLLEVARPSLHLRDKFLYHVTPLETVHVAKELGIITTKSYRPSKRTILLKYEELIQKEYINIAVLLVQSKMSLDDFLHDNSIEIEQKRYILEASVEYLEYQRGKNRVTHEKYLELFHQFTLQRAKLGLGKKLSIQTPPNPLDSHRALRTTFGIGSREGEGVTYLGIRPVYHDLDDSNYGFLRGTQIEFMNLLLSFSKDESRVEKATLISIVSLAQRSEFFKSFSWRTKIGFDSDSFLDKSSFIASVGAGYSWGNELAYLYFLVDPLFYLTQGITSGIGGSIGVSIDKYKFMNTNIEATQRVYDNGFKQIVFKLSQGLRVSQNTQIVLKYDYKDKKMINSTKREETLRAMFNYYF